MLRGRRAAVAVVCAIAALAAVTAGCGGGGTSSALQLDPVSAAATKTQQAAARIRFAMAFSSPRLPGKAARLSGAGVIDGKSAEMSFELGSLLRQAGYPGSSMKEIVLEENGDHVIYLRLGFLSSKLPGGKQWIRLDLSKLGKAAGVDVGKLLSGGQYQPSDLLSVLTAEGAKVDKLGPATIDGVATTQYHVTIDMAKALRSKGLTSPLLNGLAARMKTASEDVWIGGNGLVRRVRVSFGLPQRVHVGMTMDLYDYGAHVTIAAPPSSQVFDATQFAQQGLGGAFH